jgi:hypothetical protein
VKIRRLASYPIGWHIGCNQNELKKSFADPSFQASTGIIGLASFSGNLHALRKSVSRRIIFVYVPLHTVMRVSV